MVNIINTCKINLKYKHVFLTIFSEQPLNGQKAIWLVHDNVKYIQHKILKQYNIQTPIISLIIFYKLIMYS